MKVSLNYVHKLIGNSSVTLSNRITELRDLSYEVRLTVLNLDTLVFQRLSRDLTIYYKVFDYLTPWAPSDCFSIVIPLYYLHYVTNEFISRRLLCRTIIYHFLTSVYLLGTRDLVLSLIKI